jgi:hypothetical protein
MKFRFPLILGFFSVALAGLLPFSLYAGRTKAAASPTANTSPDANASESPIAAAKMRAIPFHGMIASVDEQARTFTIAGKQSSRSLKITDTSVITKEGQPATMKDIVANEEVRGSYYRTSDGSLEAKTVKLGPLTEAEKADREARKEKRQARKAASSASATP